MSYSYVPLMLANDKGIITEASGIVVGRSLILTAFHALEAGCHVVYPREDQPGQATIGEIRKANTYFDWVIIDFGQNIFPMRMFKIGTPQVGQTAYILSNDFGLGDWAGVYHEVVIGKVDEHRILFSPALPKGASGAGMWDEDGQLLGMVRGSLDMPSSAPIGFAVNVNDLKDAIMQARLRPRPAPLFQFPDVESESPAE